MKISSKNTITHLRSCDLKISFIVAWNVGGAFHNDRCESEKMSYGNPEVSNGSDETQRSNPALRKFERYPTHLTFYQLWVKETDP
jgi:hypothetical protein